MSSSGCFCHTHQPELRLQGLNSPWREVLHMGVRATFTRRQVIPSGRESGFYLLTKGAVRIRYTTSQGHERHFLTLGPDCLFNELAVLVPVLPGVSFFCLEAVEAWRFNPGLLAGEAFARQYPHLVCNLLEYVARRLVTYFSFLAEIGSGTSLNQLCAFLLLIDQDGLSVSQSELGTMLGLHQTTVARMVRALRAEGAIGRFTKKTLEVLNAERLHELAQPGALLSYNRRTSPFDM